MDIRIMSWAPILIRNFVIVEVLNVLRRIPQKLIKTPPLLMYTYICVYRLIKINIFLFSAFFAKLVKKKKERRGKLDSRAGWEKGKSKRKRRNRGSVNLYSSFKREWFVRQSSFSGLTRGGVFRGSCRGLPPSARESILFPPTSFPRVPFSCRRHMDVAQKDARNGGPSKGENERPLLS